MGVRRGQPTEAQSRSTSTSPRGPANGLFGFRNVAARDSDKEGVQGLSYLKSVHEIGDVVEIFGVDLKNWREVVV